jgi:hypothetical protein
MKLGDGITVGYSIDCKNVNKQGILWYLLKKI